MVKVNITEEDMIESGNNYFEQGVHEVTIKEAKRGATNDGKDFVEFELAGTEGQSGTARVWLTTEKAAKYALGILAGIMVHNKKTEAEKAKTRDNFKLITDTDQLDKAFLDRFNGFKAWYQVEKSDRTYVANDGTTKYSFDKNIYGYEPKPRQKTAAELVEAFKNDGASAPLDLSEIPFGD